MTKLYCARWVLPVTSAPFENGAVAVEAARVVAVGARSLLARQFPDSDVEDFGEAAILPGFVNCHTHLELTAMRGFMEAEEGDFFAWLRKLTIARKDRMTAEDLYISAAWGAIEAARAGVTCVGDASDAGATTLDALSGAGLRGIVFQEAFGPDERDAKEKFDFARRKVESLRAGETSLVKLGLSPHAPYTVSRPLLEMFAQYAQDERLPMMMHAAESEAESALMLKGTGAFAESFAARGLVFQAPGVSTVQHLAATGILSTRPLLAHCIRVSGEDIETIKAHNASVAHCPKSNAKLGHGRAPLAAMLRVGVTTGLGSDSVASNNTCDLLEEARFALLASRAAAETLEGGRMLGANDALQLLTLGGARALQLEHRTGALAAGLDADLIAVRLDAAHQTPAGREIFRDGRMTTVDEDELRARVRDIARRLSER
jgi:cytosine/adenosine deaminase-related metal-dependent hydrolase